MNSVIESKSAISPDSKSSGRESKRAQGSVDSSKELHNLGVEIGQWLGGLKSFLSPGNRLLIKDGGAGQNWSEELRLTQSVLRLCTRLGWKTVSISPEVGEDSRFPPKRDLAKLTEALRESVLIGEAQIDGGNVSYESWIVWRRSLFNWFNTDKTANALIEYAEAAGGELLPEAIKKLIKKGKMPSHWHSDLQRVLPKIATILNYLKVVDVMLSNDEPLKSSLFIFARVDDLIKALMEFINNRLLRFPDEDDPLFGSLDGAAYTASIELRKVHAHELKGLVEIRPTPIVFARIETAYSLLNDSLRMTLVNLAQLMDPSTEQNDVYPDLQTKEEQSIRLRENLWKILKTVQSAEQEPEKIPTKALHSELISFRDNNLLFLFYKDLETVERFIEEVVMTGEKKDLVPLLHRFGAYLETLLGLINMRVVLADHPFAPFQKEPQETFA